MEAKVGTTEENFLIQEKSYLAQEASAYKYNPGKTFLIGFGFFGISVIWSLYNAYIPIFLQSHFHLDSFFTGNIMTIDNILAIILLPYIGVLSDRIQTPLGRRRPFILLGVPLAVCFFIMIPFLATHSRLWLFMLAIIMMNLSMALFRSPVIALMPDLTPSRFRSKANGIINFMGGLGALLIYFGGKPLYDMQISLPFLAGGLLLLIASLLIILLIDERKANEIIPSYSQNPQPTEPANAQDKTQKGFKATFLFSFRELGHNLTDVIKGEKSLLRLLLAIFFWSMSFNSIETWFTSYAKYYLGVSESTGTLFLGFFAMSFMVFSIPAGFISVNFGRNNTIRLGIFVFVIALIFLILNKSNLLLVFLLVASGLGWAFININALPMVVDMAAHGKIGAFTGLYYFSSQTASIVAPPLSGFLIDIFGYPVILVFSLSVLLISLFLMMGVKKGEVFIHANEA